MTPESIKLDFFTFVVCSVCGNKIERYLAKHNPKLKTKYACKENCKSETAKAPGGTGASTYECE